jgi:hypothetical protein
MNSIAQTKYAYLTTLVGVALTSITTVYGYARTLLFRQAFSTNGQFRNAYTPMHASLRFGLSNNLTILAVVIALVGVIWLGMTMRKRRTVKES